MVKNSSESSNKFPWVLILILPLLWGLFGLLSGEGFFPYILENIKALIIIGIGLLALIGLLKLLDNK
jgi:hypothetical protein